MDLSFHGVLHSSESSLLTQEIFCLKKSNFEVLGQEYKVHMNSSRQIQELGSHLPLTVLYAVPIA